MRTLTKLNLAKSMTGTDKMKYILKLKYLVDYTTVKISFL